MTWLLQRWLAFQQERKLLFLSALIAVVGVGAYIAATSEIEAFPDVTNVQVQVITLYPGKAAEEVERRVTVPVELATNGVRGLINRRSVSLFGLSVVTLTFDDDVPMRQARVDVGARLSDADLPDGVKPSLSPESTPVGEIYRYTLEGDLPADELRLIEDWTMERELKTIPGVADVVSFGGPTRTVDVLVNPLRLTALGLSSNDVAQALGQNHANAGGGVITHGQEAYVVRSLGLFEGPESLEAAVVGTKGRNVPIRVRDIGRVRIGHQLRLGQVGRNEEDDAVEGIVLLRKGADTLETCARIREKIAALNQRLAPLGARISPYYDRTDLIERCSRTVLHNVVAGVALVCLLLTLGFGLGCWPLVLAVALIIPFALAAAFAGMRLFGVTPNLISLGAVDFGIIVETAIFAAESVLLSLRRGERGRAALTGALGEVLSPAFLCAFLLIVAFVPILSLQRVEGRIFRPLGVTLVSALVGGQLGALIFVPLLSGLLPVGLHGHGPLERWLSRCLAGCERLGRRLAGGERVAARTATACVCALALLCWGLGSEFMPALNEGALYIRATGPATISREAAVDLAREVRIRLRRIPEVLDAVSQIGRPDDGTDVNGFDNIEIHVNLTDPREWRSAGTIDGFIALAKKQLDGLPGVDLNFSQPIKDNVDEAISGVKGELVIKIIGPDLRKLQDLADAVAKVVAEVPGADDVAAERIMGQPELRFTMNRDMLARYGLRVADAEDALETALQGKVATHLIDGQGRSVEVRIKPDLPDSPSQADLAALLVPTADGARVPLGDVSTPGLREGVTRVYRDDGDRRVAVKASVRGRPVVQFVRDASQRLARDVKLPPGYRLEWSGSFENAQRAARRLMIIVPLCLAAMLIVLHSWLGDWTSVGLLVWELPFSAVGALAALRLAGLNLSVSAAAGGIVLLGVSLLTGMMLLSAARKRGSAWAGLRESGRGIMLSSGVAIVGLVPAAFSHGIGAETARPFAVMILGGLVTSLLGTLTALPALMEAALRRAPVAAEKGEAEPAAQR